MSHAQASVVAATTPGGELFDYDMLGAVGDREVIYFTDYGNNWYYGLIVGAGTSLMSLYKQVGKDGVPVNVCVTNFRLRGTFQFRLARPEEYAAMEFSYGYKPRGQLVH